ncbi:MAG: AAA family ATPase [Thiotrichales bacterium]
MNPEQHQRLILSLRRPGVLPGHAAAVDLVETHISSVLLTGTHAYKLKKPLDLGFLDFSTLEKRRICCEDEIRLNKRLAPSIYLDTVAITGSIEAPDLNGPGEPIEYAVRMRQFDQSQLLNRLLPAGQVDAELIDTLAARIAAFHAEIAVAPPDSDFGTPEVAYFPMAQNFDQIRPLLDDPAQLAQLQRIADWTAAAYAELGPTLAERKAGGYIRECHGDMHLGNMTLHEGQVAIFDGIEFNPHLRWIDVISEVAFLTMDLTDRGAPALAQRLLNGYLEHTGDYAGVALLRFYQVYRAMVRAKVSSIRLHQAGLPAAERADILRAYQSYADLAEHFTRAEIPLLVLMHGVSGSGKSWVSDVLVEALPAIRIRSDRERKRLLGDEATAGTLNTGLYAADATALTYARLLELATHLLAAGHSVVVDATFLKRDQRAAFQGLAQARGIGRGVVHTTAAVETLRRRIAARARAQGNISDADVTVLDYQLRHAEPLEADETRIVVAADNGPLDGAALADQIRKLAVS